MARRVLCNGNGKRGAKWADLICPVGRACVRPDLRDMLPRTPDRFQRELAREFGGIFAVELQDAGLPVTRGDDGCGLDHSLITVELLDGADVEADLIDAGGFMPLEQIGPDECYLSDSFDACCERVAERLLDDPDTLRFHGIEPTPRMRICDLLCLPAFLALMAQLMATGEIALFLAPA